MKKIVLLLTFMAISTFSFAQTFYIADLNCTTPRVEFGPKVGINMSNMIRKPHGVDDRSRFGVNAGMFLAYRFTPTFALQTEVMYSQQGVRKYRREPAYTGLHVDYLNIPLLAKFFLVDGLYIEFGPQLAINVDAKEKTWTRNGPQTESIRDQINDVALDIATGIGYDFDFGLMIGVRYNVGVTSVEKEHSFGPRYYKGNNQVFQLNLGWKF